MLASSGHNSNRKKTLKHTVGSNTKELSDRRASMVILGNRLVGFLSNVAAIERILRVEGTLEVASHTIYERMFPTMHDLV